MPANIIVPEGVDYYFLIYFAKFFPKLSKESFSQVNRYMLNYPEINVKFIKINVDFQKFWNVEFQIDSQTQIGGGK